MTKETRLEADINDIPPTLQDDDKSDTNEMVTWRQLLFGAFIMMALPAVVLFGSSGQLNW
jgi:hypothetical protein